MGKNVAVFVDVANIFYAAKAAGVDIDYVTLLKSASAGRDLVRAYAYTGLDPDNENQRNFHDFLRRSNYKVVSKDIRKYGDGKVKANLDIELVVDMMKTARNLDIAIVVSGDGDFAPAIRAVQEQGVRVEVISFRGNTSSDLIEVADLFTDIIQLARVEKGSRSGRRVAGDDADLSMTEVPDKITEGSGVGRGRGRGRAPRRSELEPVSAAARGRGRGRTAPIGAPSATADGREGGLMALPGERLSKAVGSLTEADLAAAEVFTLDALDDERDPADGPEPSARSDGDEAEEGTRRRRRRGGRGRGRGRGRDDGLPMDDASGERPASDPADLPDADDLAAAAYERELAAAAGADGDSDAHMDADDQDDADQDEDQDEQPTSAAAAASVAPRRPQTSPFGSVWDSQLGTAANRPAPSATPSVEDDEDFDEPEIPEYLIAEQRRGAGRPQGGARGGPRGGRSAYQSAMDRERFGRGGGGGGINRYPDVSGRSRTEPPRDAQPVGDGRARDERPRRDDRPRDASPRPVSARPSASSEEPWSEVPPELEALLRAQTSAAPAARSGTGRAAPARGRADVPASAALDADQAEATPAGAPPAPAAAPRRRTPRTTAPSPAAADAAPAASADDQPVDGPAETAAPKRRAPRKTTAKAVDSGAAATSEAPVSGDAPTALVTDDVPAPKRRAPRKAVAKDDAVTPEAAPGEAEAVVAPTPKPRAPRKPKASAPTE